jgi:hypothetical protein
MAEPAAAPYVFQAFPSWRYSPDGEAPRLVNNPDEAEELEAEGWADTPAAFQPKVERKRHGRANKVPEQPLAPPAVAARNPAFARPPLDDHRGDEG